MVEVGPGGEHSGAEGEGGGEEGVGVMGLDDGVPQEGIRGRGGREDEG